MRGDLHKKIAAFMSLVLLCVACFVPRPTRADDGPLLSNTPYATTITAGGSFTCGIFNDNKTVYCWGLNSDGQLGTGNNSNANKPIAIFDSGLLQDKEVTDISAGFQHTCLIAGYSGGVNPAIYCFGRGQSGQLGDGLDSASSIPVAVDTSGVLSGLIPKKVASGFSSTCAIAGTGPDSTNDRLYCWGENDEGQLGNGNTNASSVPVAVVGDLATAPVIDVAVGASHACAITASGAVYCWGGGGSGQLGNGGIASSSVPVQVSAGSLSGETASSISAGFFTTCVGTQESNSHCWGDNTSGNLGNGNNVQSSVPVKANLSDVKHLSNGYAHSCTAGSNSFMCWGENGSGQLANSNTVSTNSPALVTSGAIPTQSTPESTAAGFDHTCFLASGKVYCSGAGSDGQLGNGASVSSNIPVEVDLVNIPDNPASIMVSTASSFDINTTPAQLASTKNNFNVTTNSSTGYSVSISMDSTHTDNNLRTSLGHTISSTSGTVANPAALTDGQWGYALSSGTDYLVANGFDSAYSSPSPGATSKWAAMPLHSSALTIINSPIATTASGRLSELVIGVKTTATQPSGTYTGKVILTAITP